MLAYDEADDVADTPEVKFASLPSMGKAVVIPVVVEPDALAVATPDPVPVYIDREALNADELALPEYPEAEAEYVQPESVRVVFGPVKVVGSVSVDVAALRVDTTLVEVDSVPKNTNLEPTYRKNRIARTWLSESASTQPSKRISHPGSCCTPRPRKRLCTCPDKTARFIIAQRRKRMETCPCTRSSSRKPCLV